LIALYSLHNSVSSTALHTELCLRGLASPQTDISQRDGLTWDIFFYFWWCYGDKKIQ